jgi:DNA-binding FadR family transcriptional regulator
MTRAGYLKWRADLKKFHAEKSGAILREAGYDEETIRLVQDLNLKKNFPADADTRTLEDALCLVFLEFQLADLAAKTADDKTINALQKSWAKMTEAARAEALKLNYGEREMRLIEQALKAS